MFSPRSATTAKPDIARRSKSHTTKFIATSVTFISRFTSHQIWKTCSKWNKAIVTLVAKNMFLVILFLTGASTNPRNLEYNILEGTAPYGCLLLWIALWIAVLAETTTVWIAVLAETTSVWIAVLAETTSLWIAVLLWRDHICDTPYSLHPMATWTCNMCLIYLLTYLLTWQQGKQDGIHYQRPMPPPHGVFCT